MYDLIKNIAGKNDIYIEHYYINNQLYKMGHKLSSPIVMNLAINHQQIGALGPGVGIHI